MKFDDIDAFVAVVRAQSISQAARDLKLTQPAITRRVQNLEEALGAPLLDRTSKPTRPNPFGRQVFARCEAVLGEVARLRELVGADGEPAGALRLGLTQGIGDLVLRDVADDLRARFPRVEASVATAWGGQLAERVARGELDAAALWLGASAAPPRTVAAGRLARCPLVVVARRADLDRRRTRLAQWAERGWVLNPDGCGFRAGLQRALGERHLPFVLRMDTNGRELQLELVARGHGLGLVPLPLLEASAQRAELAPVPLADFKPEIDLWLLQRPALGVLQGPVERFGERVQEALAMPPRAA